MLPSLPDDKLAEAFDALSHPLRIALLRTLATPHALSEILLRAPPEEGRAGRPLARQTIREHMEPLLRLGLLDLRETRRERGQTVEYIVNQPALYALAEEARGLARVRPAVEPGAPTLAGHAATFPQAARPGLLVVKGLYEGMTFDLSPERTGRREWLVGRSRGADISLDYDPYVSSLNSRISFKKGNHWIDALPESRNGTVVNQRTLLAGKEVELDHGSVVMIGRTTLVFWG